MYVAIRRSTTDFEFDTGKFPASDNHFLDFIKDTHIYATYPSSSISSS
jgi:hypothetical protein